jgi:hypothetical protein
MSSFSSKKRAASPAEDSTAPKRPRSNTSLEAEDNNSDDQNSKTNPVAMQSEAVEEFYPEVRK